MIFFLTVTSLGLYLGYRCVRFLKRLEQKKKNEIQYTIVFCILILLIFGYFNLLFFNVGFFVMIDLMSFSHFMWFFLLELLGFKIIDDYERTS